MIDVILCILMAIQCAVNIVMALYVFSDIDVDVDTPQEKFRWFMVGIFASAMAIANGVAVDQLIQRMSV